MQEQGFEVVEYKKVTAQNIAKAVEWFSANIQKNDFPSDGITASPRNTTCSLHGIVKGMFLKTLALFVMTSPTCPFPRVTALASVPLS